ncbi:phosphotransferase [Acidimicrobiales bacterium]|nr:phosphotransferase [Acidimicrobiales bacterium]
MIRLPTHDHGVPALEHLLGDGAPLVVGEVFAPFGITIESLQVAQVRYVPGRSVTVEFQAELRMPDGSESTDTVGASSGLRLAGPVATVERNGAEIAVWRYPHDPELPGLAQVTDPDRLRSTLTDISVEPRSLHLRRRSYRATRRAALEITTDTAHLYMKVLQPSKVKRVHELHRELSAVLPVPRSHGLLEKGGVIFLEAIDGLPIRRLIENGQPIPNPAQLLALLDSFPAPAKHHVRVADPVGRVGDHVRLLSTLLPEAADRMASLVDQIAVDHDAEPDRLIHGDFHTMQVLTVGGAVSGLVDIDTCGVGSHSIDLAAYLGQLSVLALAGKAAPAFSAHGRAALAEFDQRVNPSVLRLRAAAHVLGLATGPFRVQEAAWPENTLDRIALVERWIRSAAGTDASVFN